jgi:probable HAF family extracellular repeat protein
MFLYEPAVNRCLILGLAKSPSPIFADPFVELEIRNGPYETCEVAMVASHSHSLRCCHENSTKETNMITQFTTKKASQTLFVGLIAVCCGASLAPALAQRPVPVKAKQQYQVSSLPTLGGTSSAGNSVNNQSWVAGYSRLTGNQSRHATLWRNGSLLDLGTLGGPNSSVTWNVKNTEGIIVGISQTADPEPLGEFWSSAAFYSGPYTVGFINLGFVWEQGQMRGLPNFPGGNNGFATGANNLRQVVGWAENDVHDPACVSPQVLQFRPAMWLLGPPDQIRDLPLMSGDTSGAATAINDNGQIVGISGICDQAVGRHTAKHAVLWENGGVTDLGNLGAQWWNTPNAINQRGDIVGFAGDPAFVEGDILHAFIWTREDGIRHLKPLRGRVPEHVDSEAYGINESGHVVGVSCDADGVDCRAVIWDHGVYPTDLNDLKGTFPTRLETAKDINDNGEITGRSIDANGVRTVYLAVPVGGK